MLIVAYHRHNSLALLPVPQLPLFYRFYQVKRFRWMSRCSCGKTSNLKHSSAKSQGVPLGNSGSLSAAKLRLRTLILAILMKVKVFLSNLLNFIYFLFTKTILMVELFPSGSTCSAAFSGPQTYKLPLSSLSSPSSFSK